MDMKNMKPQMEQMEQMQSLIKDNMAKMVAADAAMKSQMDLQHAMIDHMPGNNKER